MFLLRQYTEGGERWAQFDLITRLFERNGCEANPLEVFQLTFASLSKNSRTSDSSLGAAQIEHWDVVGCLVGIVGIELTLIDTGCERNRRRLRRESYPTGTHH